MKKIFGIFTLIFVILSALTSCGITVPRPETKTGEFDFTVTYEYGGETVTVSGVYVCEYNGIDWAIDSGYYRDWVGYVKGDKEDMIKLGTTEDGGTLQLVLDLYPEYFMGDLETGYNEDPTPYLSVTIIDGESVSIEHEADVIEEKYGAKIINYEYDEPIENSFGLFK